MKKNELKSGMVVEYRDGKKRLVAIDNLIGVDGAGVLPNYNDDLRHAILSDFDIIKVYNYKLHAPFGELLKDDNLELIWERKEIELTDNELEIGIKFKKQEKLFELYNRLFNVCKEYKCASIGLSDDSEFLNVMSELKELEKWQLERMKPIAKT